MEETALEEGRERRGGVGVQDRLLSCYKTGSCLLFCLLAALPWCLCLFLCVGLCRFYVHVRHERLCGTFTAPLCVLREDRQGMVMLVCILHEIIFCVG